MTLDPTRYEVDPHRGFLPSEDPLTRLPSAFDAWEAVAPHVSELLLAGRLRETLERLPIPKLAQLQARREIERAMLVLSMFGHAYVWAGERAASTIPRSIAIPWCHVAEKLGRPPIVSHASLVLRNWRRIDLDGPLTLDNLATLQLIGGGVDEQWFYLIPVAMEARGAGAIGAIVRAQGAVARKDADELALELETISDVIEDLTRIFQRTPEKCDPYVFYHRVRPYLAGWPEPGVVYEGVHDSPVTLAGGSAAQSSLFQTLDAGLGITHEDENSRPFLLAMRGHMPPAHRAFLEALEGGPSIREFVLATRNGSPPLCAYYDACVDALDRFRKTHFEIAVRYISRQAPEAEGARGTGGTELATFLRTTRDETHAKLIGE